MRPNIAPSSCTMDFEIAAHGAMRSHFPNIEILGCYFHFGQSIWRKVQDLGLRQQYTTNEDFRMLVKMLAAIAFVQTPNVPDAFEAVSERVEELELEGFDDLLLYFEDTYIGRRRRNGRRRPLFRPEVWSVRERTNQGLPRTNNQIEGWHNALQRIFVGHNGTFWKCCKSLQKEQALQHFSLTQKRAGIQIRKVSVKYAAVNKRLQQIIIQNNEQVLEFLRNVAYNIELNV